MKALACLAVGLVLASLSAVAAAPAPTAPAPRVSHHQVEAALTKAKAFLYSRQVKGNWEEAPHGVYHNNNDPNGGQWGGVTAIVTYALLAAGENPQDPRLAPAIAFLKKADLRGVYSLALRMQVWLLLPPSAEVKALARADLNRLLAMTRGEGSARGMHDYTALGRSYSHSRSQYAVLGIWAAEQMGLEVPAKYWMESENGWLEHQTADGAWTYTAPGESFSRRGRGEVPVTPGMTAAGVATLFITQDYLRAAAGAECRGNVINPAIDRGVDWLARNFHQIATDDRYFRDFPFATLYAVERVGVAGGLKYFAGHDWYAKGASWLLGLQLADGSFGDVEAGSGPMAGPSAIVVDCAFATLFLARGRAPVAISKLDYAVPGGKPVAWNQRPRDVANAVRWMGRQMEVELNWQVVNLGVSAEELMDAPIVYLSGSQAVALGNEHVDRLRAYVEMGGLVVAHADCGNPAFVASIRGLAERMFPAYPFRELPADHPIYRNLFSAARWKNRPSVQGVSNGARELILLLPSGDPARVWQTRAIKGKEEAWELAANIFRSTFGSRATLRYKGDTHLVSPRPEVEPSRKVAVARLQYTGNWDPEPAGWRRLAAILHNDFALELQVDPVKPGTGKLGGYKIAHLTGTSKLPFDQPAIDEIRAFLRGGGRLVIDAAGGSGEFVEAAEELTRKLFPEAKLRPLPADHTWYAFDRQPISIDYRPFARRTLLSGLNVGRLQAIEVDDRLAIVFSREDLSAGLVGQDFDGIIGYAPETATRLMARQILSVAPPAAPTSRPLIASPPTSAPGGPPIPASATTSTRPTTLPPPPEVPPLRY